MRAPGFLDSTAFRLVFVGQTSALRAFLNRIGSFELPVLVREVEVEPASNEDLTPATTTEETAATETPPGSGQFQFNDSQATNLTSRFYLLRSP